MTEISGPPEAPPPDPRTLEEETPHADARRWVHHFARALKTCRMYEQAENAVVDRFLDDLTSTLAAFHARWGPLVLRFSSDDVQCDEVSLYFARSREDNLALPFYRDGIRGMALRAGVTREEIEALIAAVVQVTAPNAADDDLVTLLWEAHLGHVDIDYVPAAGDVNTGSDLDDEEPMPWPEPQPEPVPEAAPSDSEVVGVEEETSGEHTARSDDWTLRELTTEVEAGFAELDALAEAEVKRFHAEYEAEHAVPVTTTAIAVVQAYTAAGGDTSDSTELGRFLPRVLRESVANGHWLEATETLAMLDRYGKGVWSRETFVQELMQPITVADSAARLDRQEPEQIVDYIEFARACGESDIDLMVSALGQCESRRVRRLLSETLVQRCKARPERLASWLSDPRWFVVRTVVHLLAAIGGDQIGGLLAGLTSHPEPAVRYALTAALAHVPYTQARSMLLELLAYDDTRTFCSALQVLGTRRDPGVATALVQILQRSDFERRPGAERRAVFHALASTGTDAVAADLEAELYRGNWMSIASDDHRLAVARCLARIGTPACLQALHRGATSKRASVRRACDIARSGPISREEEAA